MKKRLVLLLVTAMAATTVLAGCGSKDSGSSDSGKKSAKESKVENDDDTLIVGFDASFPPYGYKDDSGEYVGFDLDLAQEVCDRNDWKLVKQPIDWDSKDAELNSETIDCIWNGFTMNGREDDYTWSDPYIDNKQVVVVRSDSGIDDFSGLKGKHVEVQTDSSALAALEGDQKDLAATFADLNQVAEYNTAFMDLESGACDAIAMDIGVANYQVNSRKNPDDYKILDKEISSEQYAVGFKKGNTELKDKVQKTLDEMAEDGTVDKIAEKYADYGVPGALCIGKNSKKNEGANPGGDWSLLARHSFGRSVKKLEDIIDGDRNTDKRTWRRNVDLGRDIYSDITFFTAAWTGGCIRENVEDCTGQMDIKIIHIDYERNPADASVDGSVFRTILSVWNAHFHRIPYDCGADRFCN